MDIPPTLLASTVGSTNIDSGSLESLVGPRSNEKAPLLSQRRLFQSLSGGVSIGEPSSRTLGTFAGVFCPVALSMFSALLFLRVGFIVGNSGLLVALLQFVIAYLILVFTVSSICAISTNGAVEGGGAYFMISRTLGPELGGAIGTLFIVANIVSSALYITGCTEGLVENFGPSGYLLSEGAATLEDGHWWRFLYSSVINLLGLLVCLVGANMFAKTSLVILAVVCVCILSVIISFFAQHPKQIPIPAENPISANISMGNFTGLSSATLQSNLYSNYSTDYTAPGNVVNFASVFGVLFSGVTGIMAGANMSGELRNPARSIPKGTLSAVGFTWVLYMVLCILTAATCERFLLQNNYIYMMGVDFWAPFVTIGILTATFSANLSNLIGASRVLEAVAKDEIFGRGLHFVVQGTTASGNPFAAVFVSFIMVEFFLLIGSLNVIAQLNSVLFLLSYLATNLACLGLELASAPNFRPTFKYFTWHTAFIGLLGTVAMMFVINAIYASISIVVCLLLIIGLYLFSPSRTSNWGSISQALIFHQVRKYLLMLDSRKDHVKFWRPQILLLVANPRSSCPLIDFVNDLKKGGLYVLGHVKVGYFQNMDHDPTLEEHSYWLTLVDLLKVKAFVELTVAPTVRDGIQHLMRISGLGAMKPNTVIMGFFDEAVPQDFFQQEESSYRTDHFVHEGRPVYSLRPPGERTLELPEYVAVVRDILKLSKNVCLCRNFSVLDKTAILRSKTFTSIDVWPINFLNPSENNLFDTTSLFMYQLACILNMVSNWKGLELRVFLMSASSVDITKSRQQQLQRLLQMLRINAHIEVRHWPEVLAQQEGQLPWQLSSINPTYVNSCNQLMLKESSTTAVSFVYLPSPPEQEYDSLYLHQLSMLTAGLPPTMLVHGISPVTSTTL